MHNSLIPNLMVDDVCKTALFYQNVLGFKLVVAVADFKKEMEESNIVMELKEGDNLDWVNLKLDPEDPASAEMMFQSRISLAADLPELPELKDVAIGASQTLYLRNNDVDTQFNNLKNKVEVVQEPSTKFYGMREWVMKDPNGYILCFGQELEQG